MAGLRERGLAGALPVRRPGRLFEYHYGEGGYEETELAIQELLGVEREPLAPLRPEDAPGAQLAGADGRSAGRLLGPYEAGGVWAVLDGVGTVRVRTVADGREAVELRSRTRARTR